MIIFLICYFITHESENDIIEILLVKKHMCITYYYLSKDADKDASPKLK